jgi:3',5'-cyclic-AMP phosphodiesterase
MGGVSRRGLLAGAIAAAAGSALPASAALSRGPRRSLRVAFVTDVHLDNTEQCYRGFASCLDKVHALNVRPDLIIQGGDIIMDGLSRDEGSVARQYNAAQDILDKHCSIPIEHVIGNHDIWGWLNPSRSGITSDPRYGKSWWLSWSGHRSTYRSFDKNGWHFIILDSLMPDRGIGYAARLDTAQLQWLEQDLAQTPSNVPTCIVSHCPILSTAAMFFGPCENSGHWHVTRNLMHIDARRIKNLLYKHPNVKVCLSGHIHMAERIDYNGVKHFGMGAVCGAWWRGPMQETPPQFGVVDFYEDGHVHTTHIPC